jgi:phosphatidylserine synthase
MFFIEKKSENRSPPDLRFFRGLPAVFFFVVVVFFFRAEADGDLADTDVPAFFRVVVFLVSAIKKYLYLKQTNAKVKKTK